MKTVYIYSVGSCDAQTKRGRAESMLEYNGRTKYIRQDLEDTTANRCVIHGLIVAVEHLSEPCSVKLVTSCLIGLQSAARYKGPNCDLVHSLLNALEARGCGFESEVWVGRSRQLRARIVNGGA